RPSDAWRLHPNRLIAAGTLGGLDKIAPRSIDTQERCLDLALLEKFISGQPTPRPVAIVVQHDIPTRRHSVVQALQARPHTPIPVAVDMQQSDPPDLGMWQSMLEPAFDQVHPVYWCTGACEVVAHLVEAAPEATCVTHRRQSVDRFCRRQTLEGIV